MEGSEGMGNGGRGEVEGQKRKACDYNKEEITIWFCSLAI